MHKFLIILTILLTLDSKVFGDGDIHKVYSPNEVSVEVSYLNGLPKELEGLVWNRWTNKNFVVCSLNDIQAQFLHKRLEFVKSWVFLHWGMHDLDFSVQCKFICVDNKDLYAKLFNLNKTKVEIRYDSNKIKELIVFLLIDGSPSNTIPIPLTEICLAEFSQKFNAKFPLWSYKGMSNLNGSLDQIRSNIKDLRVYLDKNEYVYFSQGIMEMTREKYDLMTQDKRRLYDNCSLIFCLMIRKEFGENMYLHFLEKCAKSEPQESLKSILGFESYDYFDRAFFRYMKDLTNEVVLNKTPDSYLQVSEIIR